MSEMNPPATLPHEEAPVGVGVVGVVRVVDVEGVVVVGAGGVVVCVVGLGTVGVVAVVAVGTGSIGVVGTVGVVTVAEGGVSVRACVAGFASPPPHAPSTRPATSSTSAPAARAVLLPCTVAKARERPRRRRAQAARAV